VKFVSLVVSTGCLKFAISPIGSISPYNILRSGGHIIISPPELFFELFEFFLPLLLGDESVDFLVFLAKTSGVDALTSSIRSE
jgi:hypothetical protein